GSPTVPEPELYRSIQAVLPRETDQLQQSDCFNKGMLRWTLHKKVQKNPASSLSLVWLLIKELEKPFNYLFLIIVSHTKRIFCIFYYHVNCAADHRRWSPAKDKT
uniref:Uncharacterized protein n=1 Tax=Pundamilia nyererei TaxID=303518 RepID=A0A3B4GES3_9CICH